jgi:hypothetical protein
MCDQICENHARPTPQYRFYKGNPILGTIPRWTRTPALLLILFALIPREAVSQQPGTIRWLVPIRPYYGIVNYASPAIGPDGTIYIGNSAYSPGVGGEGGNNLYAISPQGTTNWIFTAAGTPVSAEIRSSAAIGADGTIYVGSANGNLYSLSPTGATNWAFPTAPGVVLSSPALGADGTIYFVSITYPALTSNYLYAVHPNGTLGWVSYLGNPGNWGLLSQFPSPAIGPDGTIYVGSADTNVYAINPDGSRKWKFPLGDQTSCSPGIGLDGTIYIGCDDKKLYALDPRGFEKWEFLTGGIVEFSPSLSSDGTIFFASLDSYVYALDPTGLQKWRLRLCFPTTPAIGADGTLYFAGCSTGTNSEASLYALSSGGSNIWTASSFYPGPWTIYSSPAIGADGTIYIPAGGYLYALYGSTPLQKSPWPMFRHDPKHTARSLQRGMSTPTLLSNGGVSMTLTVEPGLPYHVQGSTDFANWAELTNFVSDTASTQFIDSSATGLAHRFYRLATPGRPGTSSSTKQ